MAAIFLLLYSALPIGLLTLLEQLDEKKAILSALVPDPYMQVSVVLFAAWFAYALSPFASLLALSGICRKQKLGWNIPAFLISLPLTAYTIYVVANSVQALPMFH